MPASHRASTPFVKRYSQNSTQAAWGQRSPKPSRAVISHRDYASGNSRPMCNRRWLTDLNLSGSRREKKKAFLVAHNIASTDLRLSSYCSSDVYPSSNFHVAWESWCRPGDPGLPIYPKLRTRLNAWYICGQSYSLRARIKNMAPLSGRLITGRPDGPYPRHCLTSRQVFI